MRDSRNTNSQNGADDPTTNRTPAGRHVGETLPLDGATLALRDFTATGHVAGRNEILAEKLRAIDRPLREEALAGLDAQQAVLAACRDVLSVEQHWRSVFRDKARNDPALARTVRDGQYLLAEILGRVFGSDFPAAAAAQGELSGVLGNTSVRTRVLRGAAGSVDGAVPTAGTNLPSSPIFDGSLVARLIAAAPGAADPADLRNGVLTLRAAHHEVDRVALRGDPTAAAPWAAAATLLERNLLGHAASHARAERGTLRLVDRERLVALGREYDGVRDELVTDNLRLAVSVARRFTAHDYPLETALGAAARALLSAAEMYEPGRGAKFSTYAVVAMRRHVLRDRTTERHPLIRERASSVHAYEEAAYDARGRGTQPPPVEDIAATLGVSAEVLMARIQAAGRPIELSRRIRAFDPTQVEDADDIRGRGERAGLGIAGQIEDRNVGSPIIRASQGELRVVTQEVLRSLAPREREVVVMLHAEGRTKSEVAKVYGLTENRVRLIEERALLKLRQPARAARLLGFRDEED